MIIEQQLVIQAPTEPVRELTMGDGTTATAVHTDAAILGKLGEPGQAVVRRKASRIMEQFPHNVSLQLRVPCASRRRGGRRACHP
jgi:hypothetical protein